MDNNKSFEMIMKDITGGLTGNSEVDMKYLQEQSNKYKDCEYNTEILRACGRLMYELMPEDRKEKLNEVLSKYNLGFDAAMEEIGFNIYKKNYEKAMKLIEDIIKRYEVSGMYYDDAVSEYHCFNEPMQELLYQEYTKSEKDLRQAQIDYANLYLNYGSLLIEMNRLDEAAEALFIAMRWNLTYVGIAFEYKPFLLAHNDIRLRCTVNPA